MDGWIVDEQPWKAIWNFEFIAAKLFQENHYAIFISVGSISSKLGC
jgi:hypothetical protein